MPLRFSRHVTALVGGLLALALMSCGGVEQRSEEFDQASATSPHAAVAPEIVVSGCEALHPGPTCDRRSGAELRLWVRAHPDTPLVLEIDGAPRMGRWTPVEEGLRATFEAPAGVSSVVLRDPDEGWLWRLEVRELPPAPPEIERLAPLVAEGRYDEARDALTRALPDLDPRGRAEALSLLANVAFFTGELVDSDAAHVEAFEAALKAGLFARASDLAGTVLHVAIERWDPKRAESWLARLEPLGRQIPLARVFHAYFGGYLAERMGDLRRALPRLAESSRLSGMLDLKRDRAAAQLKLGAIAGRTGDLETAIRAMGELRALEGDLPPLDRAKVLNSRAWIALEVRTQGGAAEDPEPVFREALAAFRRLGERHAVAEAEINLALAALARDDAPAARAVIAASEPRSRRQERWQRLVRARVDAREGRHQEALRHFEGLARLAAAEDDRGIEWLALVGAGEAREALGDHDGALARYHLGIELHARRLRALAIHDGPERMAAAGDLADQRAVALLLRLGRSREAACVARRARIEALADLALISRDSAALTDYRRRRAALEASREAVWELPTRRREGALSMLRAQERALREELDAALAASAAPPATNSSDPCGGLRAPAQGELVLIYYPLDRGYAVFADDAAQTRGVLLDDVDAALEDPRARGEQLLGPFTAEIAAAERLRVLVSGRLSSEPLHALPHGDGFLVDHVPVVYALDLPRVAAAPDRPARAVQLAPLSNLVSGPPELSAGATALRLRGVAVDVLSGEEPDLLARLGAADLLHFVGHARGGGWQGSLELGGGHELSVADLLSSPAPRVAILSGCETGALDPTAHAGGMSLAHALLLAGADAVLATDGEVPDEVAAATTPPILVDLADGRDLAQALRAVQRTGLRESAEFSRFRVFVP